MPKLPTRLSDKAIKAEGLWSFGNMVWGIIVSAAGMVGGVTSWVLSQASWFWNAYGVAGVWLAGLATFAFAAILFCGVTLSVNQWKRRNFSHEKSKEVSPPSLSNEPDPLIINARMLAKWDVHGDLLSPVMKMDNTHYCYVQPLSDGALLTIGFTKPIPDGHIQVASNIKGLTWMESQMSERHAVIRTEGNLKGGIIHVDIVPPSAASSRRQQECLWQDAIYFDDMSYFQQKPV